MFNLKFKAMKKNVIFALIMLAACFAFGQKQDVIINSVCPVVDEEIIRALKNTNGKWLPGYNNGKPVEYTDQIAELKGFNELMAIIKKGCSSHITQLK